MSGGRCIRDDGGDVELSLEGAVLTERMLGGGVGRKEVPKNSALRERGTLWGTLGVSSVLTSDLSEPVRRGGFGGGEKACKRHLFGTVG